MEYRVVGLVTISMSTVVEADSKDEALEIASGRDNCQLLGAERMGESENEVWVHSGEIDGCVEDIGIAED